MEKIGPSTIRIITPENECGAQLSIHITALPLDELVQRLYMKGIIVDARHPNVLRVAPVPLYNTFVECFCFVDALAKLLCE